MTTEDEVTILKNKIRVLEETVEHWKQKFEKEKESNTEAQKIVSMLRKLIIMAGG